MTPQEVLKKFWGFDNFRSMQLEIIKSVLDGKDTLALLPTGGGKSICFQIPALCQEGICIVVSPLIALMKDQVHNLNKRGIPAVAIYSGMHYREIDRVFDNCAYGKIKFLYLSPERLMTDLAQERIKKMNVNLIAIDEAHCISQWGYDFRPPYLEIAKIRILHPKVPFLALTATATPEVVTDIQERLEFKAENVFQKSFRRDNLAYVVLNDEGKLEKMLSILQKVKGSSVVYVRNRKKTKEAAQFLQLNNIYADFYHAGLTNDVRSKKQDAWINNQTRVMVSTNAFGMGIDKPDVRTVIHLTLPDSLEAYFQEAGRAGRDGNRAFSILLYSETDKVELERQFEQSYPAFSEIKQVYRALGSYFQLAIGSGLGESFDFDLIEFCRHYKFKVVETFNALKILMHEGWLFMTEAVYVPSSLMVKATKEDLYDYKLRNKGFENLITTILRTYQGAFNNFVNINEGQLANFLKISGEHLRNILTALERDEIIEYRPYKETPQIIFTQPRADIQNLTIDNKRYEFLKNRQEYRIKSAIAYATKPQCRSQLLSAYFGEMEIEPCGKCDFCTNRHSDEVSNEQFDAYQNNIKQFISESRLSTRELLAKFPSHQHNKVHRVLKMLAEQEMIRMENEKLVWKVD
ncbi:MAG: ATP-dependent DNA helicase RecQ [Saprospiraceae bacterium]|jgi:ATP-dependent DNA helicase RecQ